MERPVPDRLLQGPDLTWIAVHHLEKEKSEQGHSVNDLLFLNLYRNLGERDSDYFEIFTCIKPWIPDLNCIFCQVEKAAVVENCRLGIRPSHRNEFISIIPGLLHQFPPCREFRGIICSVNQSTGQFQAELLDAVAVLTDHHHLLLRCNG